MQLPIDINDYDYPLPEERIARYPLADRGASTLLVSRDGTTEKGVFAELGRFLPPQSLLMFNNTKVVRARLVMHKPSGARVEVFCLEPHHPADYERAFAARGSSIWRCIVGNAKKWKEGAVTIPFEQQGVQCALNAYMDVPQGGAVNGEKLVRFEWDADMTFGDLLEHLGRIPIPPYLNRDSEESDNERYQTVYSRIEGSVAAPTAGLHFTPRIMDELAAAGHSFGEVTLHVGAGTFLPVKEQDATRHVMHREYFTIDRATLRKLIAGHGNTVAVGTTTVRTIESIGVLGWRAMQGDATPQEHVGQWEAYDIPPEIGGKQLAGELLKWMEVSGAEHLEASTGIMIVPGYNFRFVNGLITNFHQPRSTLLLLVSAFIGSRWREVYDTALSENMRFLSYGDSSLLFP